MGSEKPSKSEEEPGRLLGSAQLCVCVWGARRPSQGQGHAESQVEARDGSRGLFPSLEGS